MQWLQTWLSENGLPSAFVGQGVPSDGFTRTLMTRVLEEPSHAPHWPHSQTQLAHPALSARLLLLTGQYRPWFLNCALCPAFSSLLRERVRCVPSHSDHCVHCVSEHAWHVWLSPDGPRQAAPPPRRVTAKPRLRDLDPTDATPDATFSLDEHSPQPLQLPH